VTQKFDNTCFYFCLFHKTEGSVEEVTKDAMNSLKSENENLQKLVASLQEQHSTSSLEVLYAKKSNPFLNF
jgi:hypothetical protein